MGPRLRGDDKLLFFRENDDGQSHSSFFGSFDIRSRRSCISFI